MRYALLQKVLQFDPVVICNQYGRCWTKGPVVVYWISCEA